jgi:hypothetical protein
LTAIGRTAEHACGDQEQRFHSSNISVRTLEAVTQAQHPFQVAGNLTGIR